MGRETLLQLALLLASVGFGIQMADAWPLLSGRTSNVLTFLLTHAAVAVCAAAVLWKTHRHQAVVPVEVYLLAALVVASWSSDLGLLVRTAAR